MALMRGCMIGKVSFPGRFNTASGYGGLHPSKIPQIQQLLTMADTDPLASRQLEFELSHFLGNAQQPCPEYLATVAEINRQITELTRQIAQLQYAEEARRAKRKKQSTIEMAPIIVAEEKQKFQVYLDQLKAKLTQDLADWWQEFATIKAKYEAWAAELPSDREWDNLTPNQLFNKQMPFLCRIDKPHEWFDTKVETAKEIYLQIGSIIRNIAPIEETIKTSSYYPFAPQGFWDDNLGSINQLIAEITELSDNFEMFQMEYSKLEKNATVFKTISASMLGTLREKFLS